MPLLRSCTPAPIVLEATGQLDINYIIGATEIKNRKYTRIPFKIFGRVSSASIDISNVKVRVYNKMSQESVEVAVDSSGKFEASILVNDNDVILVTAYDITSEQSSNQVEIVVEFEPSSGHGLNEKFMGPAVFYPENDGTALAQTQRVWQINLVKIAAYAKEQKAPKPEIPEEVMLEPPFPNYNHGLDKFLF